MAMPSALVASVADGDASMDHPTTRRENTSKTTAQRVPGRGGRRTRTPKSPRLGSTPAPSGPHPPSARRPRTDLLEHRLFQRLLSPPGRRELRLERRDPPPRRDEFRQLLAPETGPFASVDQVLLAPVVDGLAAHAEIAGDVGDLAARRDQVQDPAPELPADTALPCRPPLGVMGMTNQTTRLHRSGGTSVSTKA